MATAKATPSPGSVLLFHIDSSDGCFDQAEASGLGDVQIRHLKTLLASQSSFESKVRRDVARFSETVIREEGRQDIVVLAVKLVEVGYKVSIRRAMGGGPGQECFRNLSYEFLLVGSSEQDSRDRVEVVVDPKFREQFKLSQQTFRYSQLLEFLPSAFVGQHSRLSTLVRLLSSEMEAAFSETGITMPPWRQTSSMLSKWKPLKARDKEVILDRNGTASKVDGDSPRDHLSLSSSRSSSSCSDVSPERGRFLTDGIQRQASIPKRIQSGFCVDSQTCGRIPEDQSVKGVDGWNQRGLCIYCALNAEQDIKTKRAGLSGRQGGGERMAQPIEYGLQKSEGFGLTKIRTVRPVGGR